VTIVDNSYLLPLFTSSSSSNNLFAALIPPASTTTPAVSTSISDAAKVPTPPWDPSSPMPQQTALTTSVLAGHPFINEGSISLDVSSASDDYRKLFALYQGVNALDGLAVQAQATGVTALQQTALENAFASGLSQVTSYVNATKFDNFQIASGQTGISQTSSSGVAVGGNLYTGQALYQGDSSQPVDAFQGPVQFSMNVKSLNGPTTEVNFDLSEMGSTPRTLGNVITYLNGKLADAGVLTRFGDKQEPAPPNTITVGGKTVTLPDAPTKYALTINGSSLETVSLSAPATADAVYVAQAATTVTTGVATTPVMGVSTVTTGNSTVVTTGSSTTTTTTTQQLLKFQTDDSSTPDAPPDAVARPGDPNSVDGRAWSQTLASATSAARATATAPDGSVYVLTDVDGAVGGQQVSGTSDVALMKYDSAGNLLFTRTLGAASSASGFALAVSADGQVAVAGSVTGALTDTNNPVTVDGDSGVDPTTSDSFVSVYDDNGDEEWTAREGATGADQANAVAFGADGSVYVAGKTQSPMTGATTSAGGGDGYLQSYSATGVRQFTQQFGTSASDSATALTVNGSSVLVGSVDNGHAVVRNFDVSTATAPVLTATQDLGDLQGGNLVGIAMNNGQLVVAGTARNPALGGTGVTQVNASNGGADVFVASLDPSLTSTSGDTLAWYGGSGDDTATAMTVANGQVYVAGKTNSDLPGTTPIGKQDGFVAQIDPSTGASTWTERFSGPGGSVAPSAIAVASGGASVLDRLGLPSGVVQTADPSSLITSATSLRAGDSFMVTANSSTPVKVTIAADDTLQTLATKIQRASGFRATVTVLNTGGVEQLRITPSSKQSVVTLGQGPVGSDALGPLGLKTGVIEDTPDPTVSSSKPLQGLDLTTALNLNSTDAIASAKTVLDQALSTLRVAYQNLATKGLPKSPPSGSSGTVPQYLTNQIANYQAALQRLTGSTG
jgi:hypothetical protein